MIGDSYAVTQDYQYLKNQRIVVDMEIRSKINNSILYVIEAKLTAPFTAKQAGKYSEFLKRWRGQSQLVLITMGGIDPELKTLLPPNTLWLTWTELAELAVRPGPRSRVERFLCGQFHEMLKEREVPMLRSLTSREYMTLGRLVRFIEFKTSLHKDTIEMINNVMARMQIFVENSWGSLLDRGYKRFGRLYSQATHPHVEIVAGFYREEKRKHISERNIQLSLDCDNMRLNVWGGWFLKKGHPEYDEDSNGEYLKRWTLPQSRLLFKKPLPDAQKEIQPHLDKCLRQFIKSRYFNV